LPKKQMLFEAPGVQSQMFTGLSFESFDTDDVTKDLVKKI